MRVVLFVSLLLALASCASAQSVYQGHVVFRALFNSSVANTETPFEGTATLVQNVTGNVSTTYVTLTLRGLQSNKSYGVHVHQWGDLSGAIPRIVPLAINHTLPTVSTVGGHFNPFNQPHNCAPHAARHAGDLGNISVATTTGPTDFVSYTLTSELLDLGLDASNVNSIIGRAIVIHENPDMCLSTGLGNWVGAGTIGIDNVPSNAASQDAVIPLDPWNFAPKANAVIYQGATIVGNVWFWSGVSGEVHMTGYIGGFTANSEYAVAIHQYGNVINEANIGGLFAGNTTTHAAPPTATRHWGILGNLKSDAAGNIIFTDITAGLELISLADVSRHSIIGRTIAFHNAAETGTEGSAGATTRFGVIGLASATAPAPPELNLSPNSAPAVAHAVLRPYINSSKANVADAPFAGTVDFHQNAVGGDVTVTIRVSGLQANKSYGIHVHTWGDLSGAIDPATGRVRTTPSSISTVGGHFDALARNNTNAFHGCAPLASRHTGDLGNITIPANANSTTVTTIVLTSELLDMGIDHDSDMFNDSIIGRAVVIHEAPDICYVPQEGLGAWVAVGVIGIHNTAGNSATQDKFPENIKANVLVLNATTKAPIGDIQLWTDAGVIRANGIVSGFEPNTVHGMHVHVWGNEDTAAASGPHYSQFLNDFGHSLPPSPTRHWGDLGNVTSDAMGNVIFNNVDINANLLSLWNPAAHGIIGRTLTFHAFADDGTTQGATAYGGRVAYGVIGLANPATVLPAIPTNPPTTNAPTTSAPTTNGTTTSPPVTTSPPTTNGTTTTPPTGTITTSPPTTNPNATTIPPTLPPSAATHNQVNVFIMLITVMMAAFVLA